MLPFLLAATVAATAPADLIVAGVVLSRQEGRSVALIRSGQRTRVVGVGETAFGGRVLAIRPDGARLEFDGGPVEIRMVGAAPLLSTMTRRPAPEPASSGLQFERREVERRLSAEIPRILAETALVPFSDEGGVRGYALSRIPEGTLLSESGLMPGDVITSINDVPIDSLATLMSLYPKLRNESEIRAIVLRGGRPVPLTVSLR